jgi:hypothetical protein
LKPGRSGKKPVKYRVYGSDENGFSVSDEPYKVTVGISKEVPPTFPSNFLGEVAATELAVVGREIALPNSNRAFYRVVAVDDQGNRSGPSDFTVSPRGFISSLPGQKAKVGTEYHSVISAIHSLGDLRTRVVDGREVMNFWDVEHPRFAITRGPAWLKIDEKTGILSGTPDAAGKAEVAVSAVLEQEARALDERSLSWGVEKVLSTTTRKIGSGTQEFVIEVQP